MEILNLFYSEIVRSIKLNLVGNYNNVEPLQRTANAIR